MNKIFTLGVALLWSMVSMAQVDETFQFVDADGNVVTHGTVISVNACEDDGFGQRMMKVPLFLKNASGQEAAVGLYENIDAKPSGNWQTCLLGKCIMLSASGYSSKAIVKGDVVHDDLMTEWILGEEQQAAVWEATLQIHVFNMTEETTFGQKVTVPGDQVIGYGPQVTVRFVYSGDSSVNGLQADARRSVREVYDLQGRRMTSSRSHGLRIVRLEDGTACKVVE